MDIEKEVMIIDDKIKELNEIRTLIKDNMKAFADCVFDIVFSEGGQSRVIIRNFRELTDARRFLRGIFGTWSDKKNGAFYACGKTITTWESTRQHPFAIWFECPVDEYPDELNGENCKWVKTTDPKEDYYYVCEV